MHTTRIDGTLYALLKNIITVIAFYNPLKWTRREHIFHNWCFHSNKLSKVKVCQCQCVKLRHEFSPLFFRIKNRIVTVMISLYPFSNKALNLKRYSTLKEIPFCGSWEDPLLRVWCAVLSQTPILPHSPPPPRIMTPSKHSLQHVYHRIYACQHVLLYIIRQISQCGSRFAYKD